MTVALVWTALVLAALGHGLFWTGLVNRIHAWGGPRFMVDALTWACLLAMFGLPVLVVWQAWTADLARFNPYASAGWVQAYLGTSTAMGLASLGVKPWIEAHRCDRAVLREWSYDRRDVAKAVGEKPLAGLFAKSLGCIPRNEALTLSIDRKQLALPRLPAELDGLTIAHVSDLHMTGRVGLDFYRYMARQVNDLRPDVIAITGDIIERDECHSWLSASLGELCAPLGVYFILGNHDLFVDPARTRETLAAAGLTYVTGRWLKADWNGADVVLGGTEAPWNRETPPLEELRARDAGRADGEFRLVLTHTPDQFRWCRAAGADLALAGHTHGGQIQLPLLGVVASPSKYGTRYACGVFRQGDTVLHVSRGIGGETPLRWRCAPELALLTLVRDTS
jgi:predicted MPP superfamily phosphohydrolase